MNKKILCALAAAAAIALVGAGCAKKETTAPPPSENQLNAPLVQDDALVLTVDKLGPNAVRLRWTAGSDLDRAGGWRLMHSTHHLPYERAYWYWRNGLAAEYIWEDIPVGKRFFRMCQWLNNQCAKLSNEVEVEVE